MTEYMVITIQKLEQHQIEQVAQLFHDVWHETQAPLQDPRKAKIRDLAFFGNRIAKRVSNTAVAMKHQEVIGFTSWFQGSLNSLFIAKEYRGVGVGSLLYAEAVRQMTHSGATQFELDCVVGNFAARAFYERRGWRIHEELQTEDETPEGRCVTSSWMMVKI
jgi:GNAT superfamily N-acetyltransferase